MREVAMDFPVILSALSRPEAYPHPAEPVEVHQTHISAVFLAGPWAYKIKKPVSLGFVDFSTLEKRHYFCTQEVRLNRRLAPSVYRGVVPVVRAGKGIQIGGGGEVVEWAVQMERLPEPARLKEAVLQGTADTNLMARLACRIAQFHATAARDPQIASFGRYDAVAENARENFRQTLPHQGHTVRPVVHTRLWVRMEQVLTGLEAMIEARADRGVPCDTHGDMHLDHVYIFPDRPEPDDLEIIDCIEFNERFRFADPVADMAFLVMELLFWGRRDLATAFADAYFTAAADPEGQELLRLYTAYRAMVRAKVDGITASDAEVPAAERAAALERGRAHWLLALGQLEPPEHRPCLILMGGLPGTGKSALAGVLADRAHLQVIRSDVVRKSLTARDELSSGTVDASNYTPEWTERTYAECLQQARTALLEGKRVIVDATFREDSRRLAFLDAARELCIPVVCLLCHASPETVQARLAHRQDDASDADWSVYLQTAGHWQEPGPLTSSAVHYVFNDGPLHLALADSLHILRFLELVPGT
jgi:aminoglycoside phosphotransferase family enzyme/predicted kinase